MLQAEIQKKYPGISIDVEFSFDDGILVLFGPSGSGKTTILNCLAGLQKPDSGFITCKGKTFFSSLNRINLLVRKRKIGYVFQDYALFPHMTAKQNVMYGIYGKCKGTNGYRMTVFEVLEMLKIIHLQDRYPSQLSGGEKQRVALARALMVEPDLVLLDEPLAALDFETRKNLQRELKNLQRVWRIPFVLVTHSRKEMAVLADEVLFLAHGKQTKYMLIDNHRTVGVSG
jgi:molybdate transport system ATP-binding protein